MNSEFTNLLTQDIPASFEISVLREGEALKLSVHPNFADFIKNNTNDPTKSIHRVHRQLQQELGLAEFSGFSELDSPWGVGNILKPLEPRPDQWVDWECPLPKRDPLFSQNYWPNLFATSASLYTICKLHLIYGQKTDNSNLQLFWLDMAVFQGSPGCATTVTLAPSFVRWIYHQEENRQVEYPTTIIKHSYQYMSGNTDESLYIRYGVSIRKPYWLNLNVPGQACGLNPESYSISNLSEIKGYKLLPHNVDSPLQQLTLITGLAALHDMVRN